MADVLTPIRKRITSIQEDFAGVSGILSKNIDFSHFKNEKSTEQHVKDIFSEASAVLSAVSINLVPETRFIKNPQQKLKDFRNEVENVRVEIDRKTRLFDNTIANVRKMYSDKLNLLSQEYNFRISSIKEQNSIKEAAHEEELEALREEFKNKLNEELSQYIIYQKNIDATFKKVKSEFDFTQKSLQSSLESSKERLVLLTKQRDMLGQTNSDVIKTIHERFKQKIDAMDSQNTAIILSLEESNSSLAQNKKEMEKRNEKEIEKLKENISNSKENFKKAIEEATEKTKLYYEKKMKKVENRHKRNMESIAHKIEINNVQSSSEFKLLQNGIIQTKKSIDICEERSREQIGVINKRTELVINEKNNEMRLISKLHIKALEQIRQQHELNLEEERNKTKKMVEIYEAKIEQTIRESGILKTRLESEITLLRRAKDKFEEEVNAAIERAKTPPTQPKEEIEKNKIDLEMFSSPSISIDRQKLSDDEVIEKELVFRIKRFFEARKHEKGFREFAIESAQKAVKYEVEGLNLRTKTSEEEIADMEKERIELQEKIKEAEDKIEMLKKHDEKEKKLTEVRLNKIIADQQTQVMMLRSELQKANEGPKSKNIMDEIKKECDQGIIEAKEEYNEIKRKNDNILADMRSNHEQEIKRIQDRAETVISNCHKQIESIDEEINKLKNEYHKDRDEDHLLWMSIRKEMADSANKVLYSRESSRPVSVVSRNSLRKPHASNK